MLPHQFGELTPRQFTRMINGYNATVRERERGAWERTRWQTFYLLNIQLGKKYKIKKLTDLLAFPDERPPKPKPLSPQKLARLKAAMNAHHAATCK